VEAIEVIDLTEDNMQERLQQDDARTIQPDNTIHSHSQEQAHASPANIAKRARSRTHAQSGRKTKRRYGVLDAADDEDEA